jgi:hypothetical protein
VLGDDKVDGKQNNDVIARMNFLCGHRNPEADGGGGIAADMLFPHPLWHQALTRKVCTHTRLCVLHACVIPPPPVCLCLDWSSGEFYRLFFFFLPCRRVISQLDKLLGRKKIKLATWQS